jgi:integrase
MDEIKRVGDFLESYESANTRAGYGSVVSQFLAYIYDYTLVDRSQRRNKEVIAKQRADIEVLAARYFLEGRDYAEDLKNFNSTSARKHAPKSCQYYYSAIREFLLYHEVEFTERQTRAARKRVKRGEAVTEEHYPTREELRRIFMQIPSLKIQTILLIQLSSGIRPGKEIMSLNIRDVTLHKNDGARVDPESDVEPDYGRILIRASIAKNKIQRVTFCSKEAAGYLKAWLRNGRDKYLSGIGKYQGDFAPDTEKCGEYVFPFTYGNYLRSFTEAVRKAGLYKRDPDSGRTTIHPHNLRKFFETQMYRVINPKVIEKLVGHESELSRVYVNFTEADLLKEYQKGEHTVTILTDIPDQLAQSKEEMRAMKDQVRDSHIETLMMRSKLLDMEKANTALSGQVQVLPEMERRMAALEKLLRKP